MNCPYRGNLKMIRNIHTNSQNLLEISDLLKGHDTLANKGKVLPVCYRCAQVPKKGLYDGFRIERMFFCSNCRQELFMAEQGSPEYQEFLFLIKGLLRRGNS